MDESNVNLFTRKSKKYRTKYLSELGNLYNDASSIDSDGLNFNSELTSQEIEDIISTRNRNA